MQLWVVIWLAAGVGVLAVAWSIYWVVQIVPVLGQGQLGLVLGAFALGVLTIPLSFGVGSIYLARRMQAGDRLARLMAIVVYASAALAFILSGIRDLTTVVVGIGCLAVVAVLAMDPATRMHFSGASVSDHGGPPTVVVARFLMVIAAGCIAVVGLMSLAFSTVDAPLAVSGLIQMGLAGLLFWLSRQLSHGSRPARVVSSALALVYLVLNFLGGNEQPGVLLPVGIAVGFIVLLWVPTASAQFFDALPLPTQPAIAAIDRAVSGAVARANPSHTGGGPLAASAFPQWTAPGASDPDGGGPPPAVTALPFVAPYAGGAAPVTPMAPDQSPPIPAPASAEPTSAESVTPEPATLGAPGGPVPDVPWSSGPVALVDGSASDAAVDAPFVPVAEDPGTDGESDEWNEASGADEWNAEPDTGTRRAIHPIVPIAAVAGALVLLLDMLLPPFMGYYGPKPLWTLGLVHFEYLLYQLGNVAHEHPAEFWYGGAALIAAVAVVVSAIVLAATRGRRGAWALLCASVVTGAASVISALVDKGLAVPRMGIGAWGALIASALLVLAAIGTLAARSSQQSAGHVLSSIAAVGVIVLAVVAIPVLRDNGSGYAASGSPAFSPPPQSGNSGNSYSSGSPYSSGTTPSTTPPPAASAGPLNTTYSFTESEAGGYTFSGTLQLGSPQQYQSGSIAEGSLTAGSACSMNPQTDAVIPAVLSLQNTSPGNFDAIAGVQLQWSSSAIAGIEVGYSNGPACDGDGQGGSGSDLMGLQSTNPLSPGAQTNADLFIWIPDYYSPNNPHGNPSLLAGADLQLVEDIDSSNNVDIVPQSVSGPGASSSNGFTIPVDATAQPAPPQGQSFQITSDGTAVMSTPSLSGTQVGTLNSGDNVTVLCTTQGDSVGGSTLWDQITSPAGYVPDSDVNTPAGGGLPTCQ